jgi:hypothetical protein
MLKFKGTTKQISPCIAAKAKYALNLSQKKPTNNKRCSYKYWVHVIETLDSLNNLSPIIVDSAKKKFKSLVA